MFNQIKASGNKSFMTSVKNVKLAEFRVKQVQSNLAIRNGLIRNKFGTVAFRGH